MKTLEEILGFRISQPTAEQLEQFKREDAARQREEAARQREDRRKYMTRRIADLEDMGAPAERLVRRLARVHGTEPMAALARVGHDRVIVLAGGVGIGKTTAALHWLVHAPGRPWFARAPQWAATSLWTRYWEQAAVAVLDDLGTEDMDPRFLSRLDDLVSHFHGRCRGLVITTNMTGPAFKARYGERVESRIREAGAFIEMHGGDMRSPRPACMPTNKGDAP
jgi:hypothetical protein